MSLRVLLVDDEKHVLSALSRVLADNGISTDTCTNPIEAFSLVDPERHAAVVSDETMPGGSGCELLNRVAEVHPGVVRVLLTGRAATDVATKAVNLGHVDRLYFKPVSGETIAEGIRSALAHRRLSLAASRLLQYARRQSDVLNALERESPGITQLQRDPSGAILIDSKSLDSLSRDLEEIPAFRTFKEPTEVQP